MTKVHRHETTEIGSIDIDKELIHEQTEPVEINLTREVKPEHIEEFGQHYLQVVEENGDAITAFKHVDVLQLDNSWLVKAKEGSGWAGIWLGKDVTFTILDLTWDDDEPPIRVAQFDNHENLRALPTGNRKPEGQPTETATDAFERRQ